MNQIGEPDWSFLDDQSAIIRFSDSWLGAISVAKKDQGEVQWPNVLRIRELMEESLYQVKFQGRPKPQGDRHGDIQGHF